jgi:hypothetical protein
VLRLSSAFSWFRPDNLSTPGPVRATDNILEKRMILWILGDKRPVEPTQRFRLLSTITRRVNHLDLSFPCHLPVLCVLASRRLCTAVSSSVGPTVCGMKNISSLKSSPACCRKSEVSNQGPQNEHQTNLRPQRARAMRLAACPPARFSSLLSLKKQPNSPTRLPEDRVF